MKKAKLWQFFEIVGGTTPGTSNPDYWNGSILWVTPSDFQADILDVINTTQKRVTKKAVDECNLFVGEEGTIVFSSRAPIGKVAIANIPVCTNQGCKLIYPRIKGIFNIRFVAYWLLANKERLNNLGSGTTFREISTRTLSRFEIPTIPIEDQNQIVDLLDSKIKKVDSLLSKKIKLQTSLEEYKQSIITRAVTKGLDPNVPMKDSGIPWIGQIPAHWSIGRIWHHYILSNGLSKGGEFFGSGYPFVTYGDVYRSESLPAIPTGLANTTVDERKKYSVKKGDVFFTRTSETVEELGLSSVALSDIPDATFAGFLIRARPLSSALLPEFSSFYFRADIHRHYFNSAVSLVTRASLSQNLLSNMPILIPPKSEQNEIANFCEKLSLRMKSASENIIQITERLNEYRSSIIKSLITGGDQNAVNS